MRRYGMTLGMMGFATALFGLGPALGGTAAAQEMEGGGDAAIPVSVSEDNPKEEPEEKALADPGGGVSVYLGSDFVSEYVSRGLVYASEPSIQPWIEVEATLNDGKPVGPFESLSAYAGNWSSFHDGAPDPARSRSNNRRLINDWYETDLYGGLRGMLTERIGGSLSFNYYTSPSNDWEDITELDLQLHYDDSHWWSGKMEGFRLRPSLRIAKELQDQGGPENWFFRPQIEPTVEVEALGTPVTVSVPFVLGFGADGQYVTTDGQERHFGYFQTGIKASMPLDVMPANSGSLSLSGGIDYILRSDEDLTLDRDPSTIVGKVGISYSF